MEIEINITASPSLEIILGNSSPDLSIEQSSSADLDISVSSPTQELQSVSAPNLDLTLSSSADLSVEQIIISPELSFVATGLRGTQGIQGDTGPSGGTDWTIDQGGTNIHSGNYVDTNTQRTDEEIQDVIGGIISGSGATTVTYDDAGNTLTISSTDTNTETTTSLSISNNILTYTDELGNDTDISLSLYLDDTNLARLTSGTLATNGIATFTRDDSSTFTVDLSTLLDTVLPLVNNLTSTDTDKALTAFMGKTLKDLIDTKADASHTHIISNVTGLQSALDGKVDDSQVLTDVPSGALFTDTQLPIIDSDTMSGALSTNVASAESVKAYVDGQTHLELGTTSSTALAGDTTTITTAQANAIIANTSKTSYPSVDATKLAGIEANATDDQTASEIRGLVESASDSNVFTDADHTKLNGIASNAEVNVQANWDETNSSSDAFIQNKPTIPTNTNTTYGISCVDGDNADEEKIRLIGSDSSTDDVVIEAGAGLSIARNGDKITLTNTVTDTDTVLTSEQVQDIVGAMVSSNTETNISVTYDDATGKLNFVSVDTTYSAAELLASIKTVDGASSGLDADKVDGLEASQFLRSDAVDSATGHVSFVNDSGIFVKSSTNASINGAVVYFSDYQSNNYSQFGWIKYKHANDAVVTGFAEGFIIGGSESTLVVRVDGSLYVDDEMVDSKQVSSVKTLSSGWHKIATAGGSVKMASAKFSIRTSHTSRPQAVHFYAYYHSSSECGITVLSNTDSSSNLSFVQLQISTDGTVYVRVNTTSTYGCYCEITENVQGASGWILDDWVNNNTFSSAVNINLYSGTSINTTSDICQESTTLDNTYT